MVVHYRGQKYSKLRREFQQREGELFTDAEFPPTNAALFVSGKTSDPNFADIVWKRPGEITQNPKLVVEGLSSTDLNQGRLGNCWFVAACSGLALEKKLWEKVVPDWKDQEWDEHHSDRYAGIFHFQFWRLGEWVDVVIDDYLPTQHGELVYMKSKDTNEFWSALLEKAYAKLAGSYEALSGGQTGDALVDFTGGVNEVIDLQKGGYQADDELRQALFKRMERAHSHKALISCSISLAEGDPPESVLECGLVKGHAYCVTDIKKMSLASGMMAMFNREHLLMIRMRNPWGQKEWNGPWSDDSQEWKKVPHKEREKMGLKVEDDGEFWMEFGDWTKWFTDTSICRQVNTRLLSLQKTWHESLYHGEWKGRSAGGCVNNKETFLHNPQYTFDITKDDTEVMVSLYQKDARDQRGLKAARSGGGGAQKREVASETGENYTIGFHIMKVEENRKFRMHVIQEKAASVIYTNRRSVFDQFNFNQGRYVVVPSTFDPGQERPFFLRLYTERASHSMELKKDIPTRGVLGYLCCCFYRTPTALVTVKLDVAQELEKQDLVGAGADPYVIVKVGSQKATTHIVKNTLEPKFDSKVQFFVSNPDSAQVRVEVWNSNVLVDRFMGQASTEVPRDGDTMRTTAHLQGRGRHSNIETHGSITFVVECSHNIRAT